jgi:tetratricopeptide (TPR) repeat protein
MRAGASEKYYREGESLFAAGAYLKAIDVYNNALKHNRPYKDCLEKTAESFFRLGDQSEKGKKFREAARYYIDASTTVSRYKDAVDRSSALYCGLGDYFLSRNLCRNAYNDYSEAAKVDPNTPGITDKIKNAEDCAVARIAFIKFDNPTGRDISGMSLGEFIFEDAVSKLHNQASKFVHIVERNELDEVLSELRLGTSGITDDFSKFQKVKGVHYLVFGKLTQVKSTQPNERVENVQTTATESYRCIERDRKGKAYETTCSRPTRVYFQRHTQSLSLALSGSVRVVKVSTGEQVISHNISTKREDKIVYADGFTRDIVNEVTVDRSVEELARARRELKDEDSLAKDMIGEVSDEMVRRILDKIDRDATVSDPVDLKLPVRKVVQSENTKM